MRGEHRLDANMPEDRQHICRAFAPGRQIVQRAPPQPRLGRHAFGGFAPPATLICRILFDHVEQLKGHRQRTNAALGQIFTLARWRDRHVAMARPGQSLGQLALVLLGQDAVERIHHEHQITVKLVEGEVGNRGLGHGGTSIRGPRPLTRQR